MKGQEDDEGSGASPLGRKAERAGTVLPGEETGEFLINSYKYLKDVCKANRASLFSVVPMDRPRSSGHRLFSLNIRKCTFSVRMTKHWQLPREVVECPFLEEFRCCLGAVQHLALGSPAGAGELDQMSYRGLFQLQGFCDAVKGAHLKNPCLQ